MVMVYHDLTCSVGAYKGCNLWDAIFAISGKEADTITLKIHTNITIQELKVKTSAQSTQSQPHFYGGFKFCDVTGRGSDVISYVCKCKQPELCLWIYLEVNQAQPNSIFKVCEAIVDGGQL